MRFMHKTVIKTTEWIVFKKFLQVETKRNFLFILNSKRLSLSLFIQNCTVSWLHKNTKKKTEELCILT